VQKVVPGGAGSKKRQALKVDVNQAIALVSTPKSTFNRTTPSSTPVPSPKPSPSPKPKNSKFGRNTGPEAEQQKRLRNKMLIFAEKVDGIRCRIDALLPDGLIKANADLEGKEKLTKFVPVLSGLSLELDRISEDAATVHAAENVRGQHVKSALTDWPTKQAGETKRMRKKCRARIESMLDKCA
jgi:hypothetical protein